MVRIITLIITIFSILSCNPMNDQSPKTQVSNSNETVSEPVVHHLNTNEFVQKLNDLDNVQILDVRTPGEISQGSLPKAKHIDYLAGEVQQKLGELDKNIPVMVYCRSGGRSSSTAEILKQAGFKEIYNLKGAGYEDLAQNIAR